MIINETDNRNRCVLVVADLGLDWRNDLLGVETVVAADSGSACGDVMDRKQKRDAKNARHRRNEERRFDRNVEAVAGYDDRIGSARRFEHDGNKRG